MTKHLLITLLFLQLFSFQCTSSKTSQTAVIAAEKPLPDKAVAVSLTWKPNLPLEDLDLAPLSAYKTISFTINNLQDTRSDSRVIGKTLEDKKIQGVFIPLVTKAAISKWFSVGIDKTLHDMSILVDNKKGLLSLDIEVLAFEIEDNITQTGTIELQVTANASQDLLIWEGAVKGTSDLYYRPKDSDGISECLSNTLKVTLNNLLTDQSFRDAVIKAFEPE